MPMQLPPEVLQMLMQKMQGMAQGGGGGGPPMPGGGGGGPPPPMPSGPPGGGNPAKGPTAPVAQPQGQPAPSQGAGQGTNGEGIPPEIWDKAAQIYQSQNNMAPEDYGGDDSMIGTEEIARILMGEVPGAPAPDPKQMILQKMLGGGGGGGQQMPPSKPSGY